MFLSDDDVNYDFRKIENVIIFDSRSEQVFQIDELEKESLK
jgi:hypothetical protein